MAKQKQHEPGNRPWRDVSVFAGGPGQKWTGWASGIILVLLLGCSAFILLPKAWMNSGQAPVSTSTPQSSTKPASTTVCSNSPSNPSDQAAPSDLSWTVAYGNSWPTSASTGPMKTVDGLAQCFAHSPAGAAMAAVGATQAVRAADTATAQKILGSRYVQNEGLVKASAGIAKTYAAQPPQSRQWARTMGFKVLSYTDAQAQILLVENWPQRGQYTGFTVTLRWVDADWKILLEPSGQLSSTPDITVDPNGFTPWEAAG